MTRDGAPQLRHPIEQLYGFLLYVYPSSFRREFGPDMRQLFRDRWRHLHHSDSDQAWTISLLRPLDAITQGVRERFREARRRWRQSARPFRGYAGRCGIAAAKQMWHGSP